MKTGKGKQARARTLARECKCTTATYRINKGQEGDVPARL